MLYKLAPVAFIGGSLVDRGGQNPIEAVRQGAAVLTGPHWQNFADAYRALHRATAAPSWCGRPRRLPPRPRQLLADQAELGACAPAPTRRWPPLGRAAAHDRGAAALSARRGRFGACVLTSRPGGIATMPAAWRLVLHRWARSTAGSPRRATARRALSLAPAGDLRRQFHRRRHRQDAARCSSVRACSRPGTSPWR